jgi:hypothetical protein
MFRRRFRAGRAIFFNSRTAPRIQTFLTGVGEGSIVETSDLEMGTLTAISAATPSIGDTLAQLISGSFSETPTPAASASSSTPTSTDSSGPATFLTLSDQAKAAAAAKAQSDQNAAANLQAYVEAHRANGTGNQPAGTQPSAAQPATGGSKVEAIVAQI